MELRVFVEAGGNWLFVNEIPDVDNVLEDGLGDSEDNSWNIVDSRIGQARPWEFTLVVPAGRHFPRARRWMGSGRGKRGVWRPDRPVRHLRL